MTRPRRRRDTQRNWSCFKYGRALYRKLITLLTVSYQALKASVMNPVKSLKTE
ncbi:hypothetical protein GCM10009415_44650 [Chitinophaga japonensis]